jgi:hydrogenase expression/formation protein HypE
MHDPTEGGIIGAAWEMAEASACGFRIFAARIEVRTATQAICAALNVDPLRLIASGALLIACRDGDRMVQGLKNAGIPAAQIGEMTEAGRTLIHPDGREEEITHLDTDEIYRIVRDESP